MRAFVAVDVSGSMNSKLADENVLKMEAAKKMALALHRNMRPDDRVAIVTFSSAYMTATGAAD